MSAARFRKPSGKPYKSRPKLCNPAAGVVVLEGWTYVHERTAEHYIRVLVEGRRPITIVTREPR